MTSITKQLREVGKLLQLDCGDNSCMFAAEKTGARTNGGCQCDLVTALTALQTKSASLAEEVERLHGLLDSNAEFPSASDQTSEVGYWRMKASDYFAAACGAAEEVARLKAERDTPHVTNFLDAVRLEALHQRERWGADHDAGKTPADWFWLLGYLSGKALQAAVAGPRDKALHHTISSAAALLNWHAALSGEDTRMRPGIDPGGVAE